MANLATRYTADDLPIWAMDALYGRDIPWRRVERFTRKGDRITAVLSDGTRKVLNKATLGE